MSAVPERRAAPTGGAARGALALLLALIALALAGVSWWWARQTRDAELALQQRIAALQQNAATKDDLAGDASDTQTSLKSLGDRIDQLDAAYTDLRKHSEEGRDTWIKAEAASLLVAANEDTQLRADPALALKALDLADARLKLIADPRLIAVRQEIARESSLLRALPPVDVEGMAVTLTALAAGVDKLPLKRTAPGHYQPGGSLGEAAEPANAGFWTRLKDAAGRVAATLFTVRRHDQPVEPLLAPREEFLLRLNLRLQLESARLALLNHEGRAFQTGTAAAAAWLQDYFDTADPAVQSALRQLSAMQKQNIAPPLPDLTAALGALRRLELPAGTAP